MICPKVPVAEIKPVERSCGYPCFKNAGKEIKPIAITVAPTMPVLAASKAPTKITERPSPPLKPEKKSDILSRSSSATFDFSNNTPIKINKGTAIKVEFVITPKILFGRVSKRNKSKTPKKLVIKAKIIETPAKVKATGKPKSKKIQTKAKRISGRKSIIFENQFNQL